MQKQLTKRHHLSSSQKVDLAQNSPNDQALNTLLKRCNIALTAEGAYRLRNASQNVNLVFFQLLGCTNQLHHHKKHTKNAFASTFCWWTLVITIAFTSMSSICNMFTGDNFKFKHLTWTWKFNEDNQFDLDLDNWKIHLISLWWFWHRIRKMNIFLEDSFKYKHLTWKLQ